jgi:hypothetical protein
VAISYRVTCFVVLVACAFQLCPAQTNTAQVLVSGHIYYENGAPVEAALVDFRCFCSIGGPLPLPTHTDKQGAFTLAYPAWGEGWLTASKESEGFPDATSALYGRTGYSSYARVDLKEGARIQGLDLHFASPNAILKLKAIERDSKLPVRNARVLISWPDNPQIMLSTDMGENGMFVMVLPKHSVSISVSAPALDSWHYQDQKSGESYLLETSGSHIDIVAELRSSSIRRP